MPIALIGRCIGCNHAIPHLSNNSLVINVVCPLCVNSRFPHLSNNGLVTNVVCPLCVNSRFDHMM